ncbi:MAG: methyltransferase domain-containing protein [Candidatus Kerfeldbacteria bacterium]|nr:methyltransferase domain-containing protein [Candidatus Kerfeldbacteria bacterium]
MHTHAAEKTIEGVQNAYNAIAEHFSQTRYAPWKSVDDLLDAYVQSGENVVDIGCGNGRFVESFRLRGIHYTGTDLSPELLAQAEKKYPAEKFVRANMEHLPFPDGSFDHALLIASFHHIPSYEKRAATLKEIARIIKSGGMIMMTNWNLHQTRYWRLHVRTYIARCFRDSTLDRGDVLVPWKSQTGELKAERYYHSFTRAELQALGKESRLTMVEQYYELHGKHVAARKGQNIVTVLKK